MSPSAIQFLEFHDAVVRSLILDADGVLAIEFSHMCVYFERERELYSVQSYETRLEATVLVQRFFHRGFLPNSERA